MLGNQNAQRGRGLDTIPAQNRVVLEVGKALSWLESESGEWMQTPKGLWVLNSQVLEQGSWRVAPSKTPLCPSPAALSSWKGTSCWRRALPNKIWTVLAQGQQEVQREKRLQPLENSVVRKASGPFFEWL